jgi:hypothetical protein
VKTTKEIEHLLEKPAEVRRELKRNKKHSDNYNFKGSEILNAYSSVCRAQKDGRELISAILVHVNPQRILTYLVVTFQKAFLEFCARTTKLNLIRFRNLPSQIVKLIIAGRILILIKVTFVVGFFSRTLQFLNQSDCWTYFRAIFTTHALV